MSHSASCFSTDLSSPCHHLFPNRHHLLIFLPLPPHLRIPSYFFRACPSLPVPLVPLLSCFHFISRFTSRAHFCPVLLAFTSLLLLPPPLSPPSSPPADLRGHCPRQVRHLPGCPLHGPPALSLSALACLCVMCVLCLCVDECVPNNIVSPFCCT